MEKLIKGIVERLGLKLENIPIVSNYYHNRMLGATRCIGLMLCDLHDLGVIEYTGTASGGSEDEHHLHVHTWTCAYITKDKDISAEEMLQKLALNPDDKQPVDCQNCKKLTSEKIQLFNKIVKMKTELVYLKASIGAKSKTYEAKFYKCWPEFYHPDNFGSDNS